MLFPVILLLLDLLPLGLFSEVTFSVLFFLTTLTKNSAIYWAQLLSFLCFIFFSIASIIIQYSLYLCVYCLLPPLEDNFVKAKMSPVLFTALISTKNIAWPIHSRHSVNIEWINEWIFWALTLLIFLDFESCLFWSLLSFYACVPVMPREGWRGIWGLWFCAWRGKLILISITGPVGCQISLRT